MKTKMHSYVKKVAAKRGFTLIELLIVIAIIGILAVALLPNILNAPKRGRDATRITAIQNIVKAVETYNADTGGYPKNRFCTTDAPAVGSDFEKMASYFTGGKYPKDPSGTTTTVDGACAGGYVYCELKAPYSYALVATMEDTNSTSTKNNTATADLPSVCDGSFVFTPSSPPGTNAYVVAQ